MKVKKLGISVLLCIVTLLSNLITINAAEIVDYKQYNFEQAEKIDFKVFSSSSLTEQSGGTYTPVTYENDIGVYADVKLAPSIDKYYKVIEYEVGDNWTNIAYFTQSDDTNLNMEGMTDSHWNNALTLEEILSASEPVNKDNFLHLFISGKDYTSTNYLCFFSADATDISGLIGVCSFEELFTSAYVEGYNEAPAIEFPVPTMSITKNSELKDEFDVVYGANYTLSYEFADYLNENGVSTHEYPVSVVINDEITKTITSVEKSGKIDFKFLTSENGTYEYKIITNQNNQYKGSFDVSYMKDDDEPDDFEISDVAPVVTFSDFPEEGVKWGTPVKMTMYTDIKSSMSFDGIVLGNKAYGTEFEFEVSENGVYNYSAWSESGVVSEGTLVIDFFYEPEETSEDDELVADLEETIYDGKLVQTGMYQTSIFGVLFVAGVVLVGVGLWKERGKHEKDN